MVKTVWSLMDNRRGSVNQALGVLKALNPSQFDIIEKKIDYTKLAALPNWIRGRSHLGITAASEQQIAAP